MSKLQTLLNFSRSRLVPRPPFGIILAGRISTRQAIILGRASTDWPSGVSGSGCQGDFVSSDLSAT